MEPISSRTNTTPSTTPSTDTTTSGGGAPAVAKASAMHEPGCPCSDAAAGGTLATSSNDLRAALGRLQAAVEELRRAVEAFAARIAGGSTSSPAQVSPVQQSPIQGGGPLPTSATSRTSAVPELSPGQSEQLRLARGQVTYRIIPVTGAAGGTVVTPPAAPAGASVELYALRDYQRGAHRTQVLEPVEGPVTVGAGETVRFVARVRGMQPGDHAIDVAGARLQVRVGTQAIDALPMMAWINENNATARGASADSVGAVLAHFGVAASGNSGRTIVSSIDRSPIQYFTAAYEAATRADPAATARRIVEAEQRARAANPGATFWVQVSDEQDKTAAQANGTAAWISELRRHLAAYGSNAKLFVAAQARTHNLVYASVIDGWATTQSAAGRDRDTAIRDIRAASASYGRPIELLQYPGNAFFDGGTPGSAAVSTASAALDGASGWFIYSANNLDVLERGGGDEGRGDIGGLVAIDGGRVLPTIALIEAELGANLGAAARAFGATGTSGAAQVAWMSDQLDAYRHTGSAPNLRQWESEIGQLLR